MYIFPLAKHLALLDHNKTHEISNNRGAKSPAKHEAHGDPNVMHKQSTNRGENLRLSMKPMAILHRIILSIVVFKFQFFLPIMLETFQSCTRRVVDTNTNSNNSLF